MTENQGEGGNKSVREERKNLSSLSDVPVDTWAAVRSGKAAGRPCWGPALGAMTSCSGKERGGKKKKKSQLEHYLPHHLKPLKLPLVTMLSELWY